MRTKEKQDQIAVRMYSFYSKQIMFLRYSFSDNRRKMFVKSPPASFSTDAYFALQISSLVHYECPADVDCARNNCVLAFRLRKYRKVQITPFKST